MILRHRFRFLPLLLAALLLIGCRDPLPEDVSSPDAEGSRESVSAVDSDSADGGASAVSGDSVPAGEPHMSFRQEGDGGHIAVWWWDAFQGIREGDREKYLQFLAENGVNEIYYCPGNCREEAIQTFVREAGRRGMRVAWLTGDASWVAEGNDGGEKAVDRFLEYQKNAPEDCRFYGIHLDVEPHQQSDFFDRRAEYMQRFAELAVSLSPAVHQAGYALEWDVAFWFDQDRVNDEAGEEKLLLEVLASLSDTLCVMSYRDTASAVLSICREELAAAEDKGCRVVCGVETHSEEGDQVSFMEEGKTVMYKELEKLYATLAEEEQDYGIAVHYLDTWYELKN